MRERTDAVLAGLVENLRPARTLRARDGGALFVAAGLLALVAAWFGLGVRGDMAASRIEPVFLIASGSLLLLAIAAGSTVIAMAAPRVGNRHDGWIWAAAMAAVLPVSAVIARMAAPATQPESVSGGLYCTAASAALGLAVMLVLTVWLRRGAPTSPALAGWLTGIAGGASGAFALGFHCPDGDLFHVAMWHGGAVVASAMAGRLVVPRLVRW